MIAASIKKLEFNKIRLRLINMCSSVIAKEEAEKLIPHTDVKIIASMLQETSEARDMLRLFPTFSLGGLRDIRSALYRVGKGGTLEAVDFLDILDSIQGAARIKTFFSTAKGDFSSMRELAKRIYLFKTLEHKITDCITPEGAVADNASQALARIRRSSRENQERVKAKLDSLIRDANFQRYLQDNIVTMRDGRYVVPVKQEYRVNVPGLVHDQSASGATLFIEPMAVVEINNTLRRLIIEEEQEIIKVLTELSELVGVHSQELESTVFAMAKLDFIMAKGLLSSKMDAVSPGISKDGSLVIKKGRHPLIGEKAVPADLHLGKSFDMLVITGPNTGGKTVTLKTVGLFTLMFEAGLHVPAEEGTILYPFKKIFADIGDEQSIEQSLSTFSSHMKNIVYIVTESDAETLILLDELGAGTDPTEGAAIAMAILDNLKEKISKVIATTHYSELKAYAYANERVENASVEFDVETLMPTYKLAIGIPGSSNAFEIAKRLGLPAYIVEKAQSFLSKENIKVADLIKSLEESQRKAKEERQQIVAELKEATAKHFLAEEKLRNIEIEASEKMLAAYKKANEIIAQAKAQAEETYKQLHTTLTEEARKAQNSALKETKNKLAEQQKLINEKLAEVPKVVPLYTVKKGDSVFLKKLNLMATVLKEPDNDGEVLVQAGIMKITMQLNELTPAEEKKKILYSNVGAISKEKRINMGNVVDVRGKNVDEALEDIEKFLDDAYLAGLNNINIIHGKGTGVLRKAIGEHLKGDKRILAQRFGDINEGGMGVTVVALKQ